MQFPIERGRRYGSGCRTVARARHGRFRSIAPRPCRLERAPAPRLARSPAASPSLLRLEGLAVFAAAACRLFPSRRLLAAVRAAAPCARPRDGRLSLRPAASARRPTISRPYVTSRRLALGAAGLALGAPVAAGARADLDRPYRPRSRARLRPEIRDRLRRYPSRPLRARGVLTTPTRGRVFHARPRPSDRPGAGQDEPARRPRPRPGAPPRAAGRRTTGRTGCRPTPSPSSIATASSSSTRAPTPALKRLPRWHPYFRLAVHFDIEPEAGSGTAIARARDRAERRQADRRSPICTSTTTAASPRFPAAASLVSPGERAAAAGLGGQLHGYLPQRWPSSFDPEPLVFADEPYGPFARSRRLTADGALVACRRRAIRPITSRSSLDDGERRDRLRRRRRLQPGRTCSPDASTGSAPMKPPRCATLARLAALAAERPTVLSADP